MANNKGNASGKNEKINGSPGNNDDQLEGESGPEVLDGKSGDDDVAGGGGDDWVKGGSGDDLLRYNATAHYGSSAYYDGGAHTDELLLELNYDQWMDLTLQDDTARLLPWIQAQLNGSGTANGHSFTFDAFDLTIRKFESLRVQVDGVELNPEDEPVTLADDFYTIDEDAVSVDGNVRDNDDVPDLVRLLEIISPTTEGSTVIDDRFGGFTYTFDDTFQYLAVGETATQTFDYKVTDADLDTDTATVEITITGVNDAPIAAADVDMVDENEQVIVDVLANDFDIDATDVHTVDQVTLVSDGRGPAAQGAAPTVEIFDNKVLFTTGAAYDHLAANESETATISYTMSDQHGAESTATLDITIKGVNDAPVAFDDTATTEENSNISVDVLANDTDLDASDVHTVDAVNILDDGRSGPQTTEPAPVASIVANEVLFSVGTAYDYLAVGESTVATIQYDMSDNNGGTDTAELAVTITGLNDAPTAVADSASVDEDSEVTIDAVSNDFDVDLTDDYEIVSVQQGSGGIVSVVNGQLVFNTNGDFENLNVGDSTIVDLEYTLEDEHGAIDTAIASVRVDGVNDAPVAHLDEATTTESESVTFNVLDNDTDVDDGHSFTLIGAQIVYGEGSVSLSSNGNVTFDPDGEYEHVGPGQQAEAIIEYTMQDEHGAQSTSAAFVTINGEYDAPSLLDVLPAQSIATTFDLATDWHIERLNQLGTSSSIFFGSTSNPTSWGGGFSLAFNGQSIFGDNETSITGAPGVIDINPGPRTLINVDLFSDELGTGARFKASFNPDFEFSLTPFAEIIGGTVDANHGVNTSISSVSNIGGFYKLNTSSAADSGNSIAVDTPDSYNVGIDGNLDASLTISASAKYGIVGFTDTWSSSSTLFNEDIDFTLLGAGIDTKNGELDLTVFDTDFSLAEGIALPGGIGSINFYDESDDTATTSTSGDTTATETQQKVTGIRLDIDDILGKLPAPVGPIFRNLDNAKSFGAGDWLDFSFDYTVAGMGFTFDLVLDIDSQTSADFTVDLLFNKPVLVEGYDDPIVAIRDAEWDNLPAFKSYDGTPVSVLPLFNTQLDYGNDLSLNLTGTLDYKVGEVSASIDIVDIINESASLGPIISGAPEIFNVDLIDIVGVNFGVLATDQASGGAFLVA